MADLTVDADFRRFVASGDPAALAAVFDALASDLLLVAAHVAWRGTDAEDLVQATFLTAIEARASFDPERPVRPWLIAILVNHARSSNRRGRRQPDASRLGRVEGETLDPADQLQAREVIEAVAAAIETMPEHYRQVLHLRLLHDLKLTQIASALSIPLATAKSRLNRGTERLQRALPTGVAGAVLAAAMAMTTERLSAMRQTVLDAIPPKLLPIASAPWGAKLVMTLAMVPLAAIWLVVSLWPESQRTPDAAVASASSMLAEARQTPTDAVPAADAAAPDAAERVAVTPVAQSIPFDGMTVRGRLLDPATGVGLAGVAIVHPKMSFVNLMLAGALAGGDLAEQDLTAKGTADGSGNFELRFRGQTGVSYRLLAGASDHVRTHVELGVLAKGVHELGDIEVHAGTLVRFSVVDEHELPVADARLMLAPPGEWQVFAGKAMGASVLRAQTNAAGEFELRLMPGPWELQNDDDHRLREPKQVLVEDTAVQRVTVRVARLEAVATITGLVTDEAGSPLAGIEIRQAGANSRRVTDANGRFEYAAVGGLGGVMLMAEDVRAFRYDDATANVRLPWNGDDVVMQLHRIQGLRLQVVRESTGEPVERFAVVDLGTAFPKPRMQDHAGGRVTLPEAIGETRELLVLPSGDDCTATSILEFAADERLLHRITLRDKVAMQVLVVDVDGRPMHGSTVELLDPMGRAISGLEVPVYPDELTSSLLPNQVLVVAEDQSDRNGLLTLGAGSGHAGLVLRVQGDGHARALVRDVVFSPRELRVVVTLAGTVAGTLGPDVTMRRLYEAHGTKQAMFGSRIAPKAPFGVFLTRGSERQPAADATFAVTADGEFRATGVPAGTWQVHLSLPTDSTLERSSWSQHIGTVEALQAGETRDFAVDVDAAIFGRLLGSVGFDGQPWAERPFVLQLAPTAGDPDFPLSIRLLTDAAGRFELPRALVGSCSVAIAFDPDIEGKHAYLQLPQTFLVSAGRTTEAEFAALRRRARIRLLAADGQPVAGCQFQLRRGTVTRGLSDARTNADGWFTLDPVPFGAFQLVAQLGEVQQPFDVELPQSERTAEWQLRLP